MSAAVAARSQPHHSTHTSNPSSRMGTSSPTDTKKNALKVEDNSKRNIPAQASETSKITPPRTGAAGSEKEANSSGKEEADSTSNAEASQALAPPPRPTAQNASDGQDYFNTTHNNTHLSLEPNPFEQSFSNPAAETPSKSLLPSVAALASPASLLGGATSSTGFNWPNSLRSGPLSPAMLQGPAGGASDYFGDSHLRGGFPTPNESSLRTGLTPGGGGSMFPAPSPGSQAIFQQLASGGATPSTLDFHRTAMTAAAASRKTDIPATTQASGSEMDQAASQTAGAVVGSDRKTAQAPVIQGPTDPFGQHDANDAANGLFLLAQAQSQARDGRQDQTQFATPSKPVGQPQQQGIPAQVPAQAAAAAAVQSQETSPNLAKIAARNAGGSVRGGSLSGSVGGMSEMSAELSDSGMSERTKPSTRGKGKKSGSAKAQTSNGRRKAEDTPSKAPASKKAKGNSGTAMPDFSIDSDEDMNKDDDGLNADGKKMTDEEKRKNFLERNRVAALKCRQRKKQWLANLQAKVEIFSSENDALSAQVTQLREEVVNLKTLLLAHKDCPVSQAQGLTSMGMNGMGADYGHHANPYGMAMANSQVMQAGMQRR
ncbi:MAG: hypothetical protein M1825_003995 [Sarcosagium campestre]|nr:MAG: hypothetical protein M1825_003995 [Sarcosagium campestre]